MVSHFWSAHTPRIVKQGKEFHEGEGSSSYTTLIAGGMIDISNFPLILKVEA
jgi:hypothetical protein